ncbi:hypothetical protein B0H11DRAFT_1706585 [Mycena galericulata]|nr:hypothetical protein B0H11DRAFT_1706585 [Mycena galericulata]
MSFFDSLAPNLPRPKGILSPEEAGAKADKVRHQLFKSWRHLQEIVLAHEDTIQKRWKKRTAVKRKQLLEGIDPTLSKRHAPEIAALGSRSPNLQDNRNDFVLPYLNLEDLSINNGTQSHRKCDVTRHDFPVSVASPLGLLHARAHYFPSQFAWFDDDTLHFGIVAHGIQRYHALDCAMVSFGDESTYGKVLEYSEPLDESDENSPDGGQMEHLLHESMSFGDGLVVLETQSKLMDFLLATVSKILIDLDLSKLTPAAPLPAPVIPILNTEFQWKSSARTNVLRPYGPPPVFSIDDIAVLLESQYELAMQHLSDLRTDPMYLAETLQSYYQHRLETILGEAPASLIQSRAVRLMLTDAYASFSYYHVAKATIEEFRIVQIRYPNGVARACELPPEYENAVMSFYPILGLLEARITKLHNQTICSSSALRSGLSVRCTDSNFGKHEMMFKPQPSNGLYTYLTLLLQEDQTHLWQVARIFDQIDRITEDPDQHRRISPLIANLLSQWGVVNECKTILEWHRPAVQDSESIPEGVQKRLKKWVPLLASITEGNGPEPNLASKAFPVSRFMYPKGPRNAAWAGKCQHVDSDFTSFWKAADPWLAKACGDELFTLGKRAMAPFAVVPTNWMELAAPRLPVQPGNSPSAAAVLPFGGASQTPVTKETNQIPKQKLKTRGVPSVPAEDVDDGSEPAENSVTATPVSAKVYKVFSTLFNAAEDEEIALQQSSVAWKDIQTAFAQLDFTLHKTRGSAWIFRHPDGRRSVNVHEPHPEPTMRFWDARRFGRRLTRRFEWTLDSFVLDTSAAR